MKTFLDIEKRLQRKGYQTIAGLDEAGRGPWAGPVVAAAVILPKRFRANNLKDSKKLNPLTRKRWYNFIVQKTCFGVGISTHTEIDQYGIIKATNFAFQRAVNVLAIKPDFLMIDGRDKLYFEEPFETYIRGDENIRSICCASIVAKVIRDRIMLDLAQKYPHYLFEKHKGYGTALHQKAIKTFGISEIHRRSFKPIKETYQLCQQAKNQF